MITVYPYKDLGQADYGWLQARYHFSFSNYYNPKRTGFGALLVINDDRVSGQKGFPKHPHDNMEIITYVRTGAITHKDSVGNEGRTEAGDVQVMSAGTGIFHSEYNLENEDTTLYQIWIEPKVRNVSPRWDTFQFPKQPVSDKLNLLVSGDGTAPLFIHQDAFIYAGRLNAETTLSHTIHKQAYVLVSQGEIEIDGQKLKKGDGAEITNTSSVVIKALTDSEILVIDVPA